MSQATPNSPAADTAVSGAHHAFDDNQLIVERREKLKVLREAQQQGKGVAFPNDFKPSDKAAGLFELHGDATN
jgi:lysyl-tRNA synthetase class 2